MTSQEKQVLAALDQKIDANPEALTSEQIRLYRKLLIRYIAAASSEVARKIAGTDPGTLRATRAGVWARHGELAVA